MSRSTTAWAPRARRVSPALGLGALALAGCADLAELDEPVDALRACSSLDAAIGDGPVAAPAPTGRAAGADASAENEADAASPPAPRVEVVGAVASPSKCRAQVTIGPDGQSLRLAFDDMVLATDQGLAYQLCTVEALVRVPPGHALTLRGVSGAATLALPAGASALFSTSYTFQRLASTSGQRQSASFTGPRDGSVSFENRFPEPGFSCGGDVIVLDTRVYLDNPTGAPAKLTLASLDLAQFALRPCS